MPQPSRVHRKRYNVTGHAHEFTFSCVHRLPFLRADRTCRWLADSIDAVRDQLELSVWAFVFMPEHVHLIIWPRRPDYDVARILQKIKEPVSKKAIRHLERTDSQWLPRISVKEGSRVRRRFWKKGGGYDRNITEPSTLAKMIDYIHLNPVRRGLVERAVDWPWSSAAEFTGLGHSPLLLDPISPEWVHEKRNG